MVGSPPHTWRIHGSIKEVQGYQGITSTYVENTLGGYLKTDLTKDHLHIRGEYSKQIPL